MEEYLKNAHFVFYWLCRTNNYISQMVFYPHTSEASLQYNEQFLLFWHEAWRGNYYHPKPHINVFLIGCDGDHEWRSN